MTNNIRNITLALLTGAAVSTSHAAITATLTTSEVTGLSGGTSGAFNQTFVDPDSGISVTLNFSFTATNGTFNQVSSRLGLTGGQDDGSAADTTSFNGAEELGLEVSFVSSSVLADVTFGVSNLDIYRAAPGSGDSGTISYQWVSNNGTDLVTATASGAAAEDVGDTVSTFDIVAGGYTGTFQVTGGTNTGPRIGTDGISITLSATEAIPEPSSTALLGLGGLALILRRRRA